MTTHGMRIYCDGTALSHQLGVGAVLIADDGTRHTLSHALERRGCSNEAEALALILALREAQRLHARVLDVWCDSTILVAHTVGGARTRIARLQCVYDEARLLLGAFDRVQMQWLPRHRNTDADTLARQALGLKPKPPKINQKKKR